MGLKRRTLHSCFDLCLLEISVYDLKKVSQLCTNPISLSSHGEPKDSRFSTLPVEAILMLLTAIVLPLRSQDAE